MAVLIASDLAKDVAGAPLLRGASLKLERRDRLTLAGRNGAGKTTLLRMLAGEAERDGGELVLQKGARVALHDQRPPLELDLALRDYILGGCADLVAIEEELARLEQAMAAGEADAATLARYGTAQARLEHAGGYAWRERALAQVRGLGFGDEDLDRDLRSFSGGELTRASLARVLATDPDLLLLDEPTNHLDIAALEWLEQRLTELDAAIVLVAHDRWFLEAVGTAVLELEGGRARFFPGTWHAWRREKAARELAAGRAAERQGAEVARLERFVERFRAGTRARQAQARVKKLERLRPVADGGAPPRRGADGELAFAFAPAKRSGRVVFELERATLEAGGTPLLSDAELWLERGEHVSLVGPNGAGKTTLLETLAGRREPAAGKLRRGHNIQLAYLSQDADELGTQGTVLAAAQRATGLTPGKARALLGRFLFSGEEAEKPLSALSGGERRRLALAILVHSEANVLLLDEPTNHLDLDGREALEAALQGFGGSVLLVSHDRALLDAVGTRTVAIEDGTLRNYTGGWPEYLRAREARRSAGGGGDAVGGTAKRSRAEPNDARRSSNQPTVGKRPRKQRGPAAGGRRGAGPSKNQLARRERLEEEIAAAEASLAELEDALADPAAWADPERTARSTERHEEARRRVDELYARYEALAS